MKIYFDFFIFYKSFNFCRLFNLHNYDQRMFMFIASFVMLTDFLAQFPVKVMKF